MRQKRSVEVREASGFVHVYFSAAGIQENRKVIRRLAEVEEFASFGKSQDEYLVNRFTLGIEANYENIMGNYSGAVFQITGALEMAIERMKEVVR